MPGYGTGYPNWFNCPNERRQRNEDWDRLLAPRRPPHKISLTGRTRPTPRNGKGHPRKSWTTYEWKCSCGRTGWSSHIDLERMANRTT